jgi:hypothetical protein
VLLLELPVRAMTPGCDGRIVDCVPALFVFVFVLELELDAFSRSRCMALNALFSPNGAVDRSPPPAVVERSRIRLDLDFEDFLVLFAFALSAAPAPAPAPAPL